MEFKDTNKPTAMTRRQTLGLLAGTASILIAPGLIASPAMAGSKPSPTGKVVIGMSQEPVNFNPLMPHVETDEGVHHAIFDKLFSIDEAGVITPSLAVEVPSLENGGISADGLTWRVKLRDDVNWHDGKRFTAEDVKFTLELAVDPKFRSGRTNGHDLVLNISVVSPTELTWSMTRAFAPYLSILASTFMVPKHAFDGVEDKNTAPFNNNPFGTGPFKWSKRVAGDHIEMVANDSYFGDGPYIETLIYKYIPDTTVLYTQFKTGDIDAVGIKYISPDYYEEAKTLAERSVTIAPVATVEVLMFNLGRPQFREKAVREALYCALDKRSIIDALYYGIPSETETYMSKALVYYNPDLPKHEYDLERAKAILEGAGWVAGADGVRSKDGVRLAFSVSTTSGDHLREQAQQVIQQSFAEIGVEMSISNFPPAVMWGEYFFQSKYDIALAGVPYLVGGDPDTSEFFSSKSIPVQGGGGMNTAQYSNPKVDQLLQEAAATFAVDGRQKKYFEIQQILRDELAFLPIYQQAFVYGCKSQLEGMKPNANTQINTWNVATWRWKNA
jgi:peptide/nickel transport system substrate-binding protein